MSCIICRSQIKSYISKKGYEILSNAKINLILRRGLNLIVDLYMHVDARFELVLFSKVIGVILCCHFLWWNNRMSLYR